MNTQNNTEQAATRRWLDRFVVWLVGRDEYHDGEHIAHEPSLWQRIKRTCPTKPTIGMITVRYVLEEPDNTKDQAQP